MLDLAEQFVRVCAQLAQIHFTVADAPGQRVFDGVWLLVNLFLHVVTVSAFVARVVLQVRFDLLAFYLLAFGIEYGHAATGHFRDIPLFQEDKATGNRQERQLVRSDEVFAHAQTDNHRATGTRCQQCGRIAGIHDHRTVRTAQLRDSTQHRITQRAALLQLPVHQVSNHFGVSFRDEGVAARFQFFAQRFVVFDNAVVHDHDVFRHMRVRVTFRRFSVRRPAGVRNTGTTVQRMFFRGLGQHLHFTETTQTGHMTFCIDDSQTG